ncbi:hypothetical protein HK096_009096, partial [Nowakowskiella sp. JEL0078]
SPQSLSRTSSSPSLSINKVKTDSAPVVGLDYNVSNRTSVSTHQNHPPKSVISFQSVKPKDLTSDLDSSPKKPFFSLCQDNNISEAKKYITHHKSLILNSINYPLDSHENTALHLSVTFNDYHLTALLLLKGANPNALNKSGVSPTTLAQALNHRSLNPLLRSHGGLSQDPKPSSPKRQSTDLLDRIDTFTPTPTAAAYLGLDTGLPPTPNGLHKAAYAGHTALVVRKLENGESPDTMDDVGMTALAWACLTGRTATVRVLINPCKNLDCAAVPPLFGAVYSGVEELVWMIVDAGANLDLCVGNKTALDVAAAFKRKAVFRGLVARGARSSGCWGDGFAKGLEMMNRYRRTTNVWVSGCEDIASGVVDSQVRSLKMKLGALSAQDHELLREFKALISDKSIISNQKMEFLPPVDSPRDQRTRGNGRKKTNSMREGMNLE